MKYVLDHFKKADPILYAVAQKVQIEKLEKSNDYFASLCREIIGQQLSSASGNAILTRFYVLFPDKKVTVEGVQKYSEDQLRATGMSWAKARYIKNLAEQVANKSVNLTTLDILDDAGVITELTKVKGIGPWTAEMFLMFSLAREDVFSYGDLGLRNAMKSLYAFKRKPTKSQVERIVEKWTPYRTYACLVLWESLEIDTNG